MSVPVRNPKRVKENFKLPYNTKILTVVIPGGGHMSALVSSLYSHIFLNFVINVIGIIKIMLNVFLQCFKEPT